MTNIIKKIYQEEEEIEPLSKSRSLNISKHILNKFDDQVNLTQLNHEEM